MVVVWLVCYSKMGLSGAQKNAISSSWKTISADFKNNGALLFDL